MVDCLELLLTVEFWHVVHFSCKCVERMNEEISWRENRLSEVLMTKIDCVRDEHCLGFGVNSSLVAIMVERNTSAETIASSVIPGFPSAWFVVNGDRYPKGGQWCGTIIKISAIQVLSC